MVFYHMRWIRPKQFECELVWYFAILYQGARIFKLASSQYKTCLKIAQILNCHSCQLKSVQSTLFLTLNCIFEKYPHFSYYTVSLNKEKKGLLSRRRRKTLELGPFWTNCTIQYPSRQWTAATFPARLVSHAKFRPRLRWRKVLALRRTKQ